MPDSSSNNKARMNPLPRRIGWALMALALAIGWGARSAGWTHYGPFPAVVVGLIVGGSGFLLVITDRMVRGLYSSLPPPSASHDEGEEK